MKKILLAFDGGHFSEGAFEFARKMNEHRRINVTGIFLPEVDFALLSDYSNNGIGGIFSIPLKEESNPDRRLKNVAKFEKECKINHIEYTIHNDSIEFALPQLKHETSFADLLILGSESFYKNIGADEPNQYLEDTLHQAQCPVIVVPENFTYPQTNILAYDGSESSVYAIKQFAYLFPELTPNPTILLFAVNTDNTPIPSLKNIEELTKSHFKDLEIYKFEEDIKVYLNSWIKRKNNAILVAGGYGRSGISRLLHKSFLTEIIEDHHTPVFITHHK